MTVDAESLDDFHYEIPSKQESLYRTLGGGSLGSRGQSPLARANSCCA